MIEIYPFDKEIYNILMQQMNEAVKNGFYHYLQIQFAYNTNHIEGSTLTPEQTVEIFDKGTVSGKVIVKDVIETSNSFSLFSYVLKNAMQPLSEQMILEMHRILKQGVLEYGVDIAGKYKKEQNQIGFINPISTALVKDVPKLMKELIKDWSQNAQHDLIELLDFHVNFENIHPFMDGNGRVGRAILFKECLKNEIMPFIIYDEFKSFYYRGLDQWRNGDTQQLLETCNAAQEIFYRNWRYFCGEESTLIYPSYEHGQFNEETNPVNRKGKNR